jgi:hypothetical protein
MARKYLGGQDPLEFAKPFRMRGGLMWDRHAIDAKLDQMSGLTPAVATVTDAEETRREYLKLMERFSAPSTAKP